eukprot:Opistho-2@38158
MAESLSAMLAHCTPSHTILQCIAHDEGDGSVIDAEAASFDRETHSHLMDAIERLAVDRSLPPQDAMKPSDLISLACACGPIMLAGSRIFPQSYSTACELWMSAQLSAKEGVRDAGYVFEGIAKAYAKMCRKGSDSFGTADDFLPYSLAMCAAVELAKFPAVGPSLDAILPPLLRLADHYDVRWKVAAFKSLCHVVEACNPSDLRLNARADVLVECVLTHISMREELLLPWMLQFHCLLLKIVGPPRVLSRTNTVGDYLKDAGVSTVLRDAHFEDKIVIRKIYAKALAVYVQTLGISTAAHLKRLVPIVSEYLEKGPDDEMRGASLALVHSLMKHCWPRVRHHAPELVFGIVALALDVAPERESSDDKRALWNRSIDALKMVRECCGEDALRPLVAELGDGVDTLPHLRDVLEAWGV